MNRRFAVLGLAVAMCGTAVAGQTSQTAASSTPVVVRVESVGPQLTRVRVMRDGVEVATLESAAFTISTDPRGGTAIASSDTLTITTDSKTLRFRGDIEAQFRLDQTTWVLQTRDTLGTTWRMFGTGRPGPYTRP